MTGRSFLTFVVIWRHLTGASRTEEHFSSNNVFLRLVIVRGHLTGIASLKERGSSSDSSCYRLPYDDNIGYKNFRSIQMFTWIFFPSYNIVQNTATDTKSFWGKWKKSVIFCVLPRILPEITSLLSENVWTGGATLQNI